MFFGFLKSVGAPNVNMCVCFCGIYERVHVQYLSVLNSERCLKKRKKNVCMCTFLHAVESSSVGLCGSEEGGVCGVEWMHQYSAVPPHEECVGGGKEGGGGGAGQPFLRAERCDGLEQSGSTGGRRIGPPRPGPLDLPKLEALHQFRQEN